MMWLIVLTPPLLVLPLIWAAARPRHSRALKTRRMIRSRLFYLMNLVIYIDRADWWIGYYRGPNNHYVCLLPTVVVRWRRGRA